MSNAIKSGSVVLSISALLSTPKLILIAAKTMYDQGVEDIPTEDTLWQGFQNLMSYMMDDEEFDSSDLYAYPEKVELGFMEDEGDEYFYVAFDNGYTIRIEPGSDTGTAEKNDIEVAKSFAISSRVMLRLPKALRESADRDMFALSRPLSPADANDEGEVEGQLVHLETNKVVGVVRYNLTTDTFKWQVVK